MKKEILTKGGVCQASLRSEEAIQEIQADLEGNSWMPLTIRWLEAIKDPTRFKLIFLLYRYDKLCVCDIANVLAVSSSSVSQHLRKLKDMDLVFAYRQKQTLFYTLKDADFIAFFARLVDEDVTDERVATGS